MINFGDIIDRVSNKIGNAVDSAVDTAKSTAKRAYNAVSNAISGSEPAAKTETKKKVKPASPQSVMNEKGKTVGNVGDSFNTTKKAATKKTPVNTKTDAPKKSTTTTKKDDAVQSKYQKRIKEIKYAAVNIGVSEEEIDKLLQDKSISQEDIMMALKSVRHMKNKGIANDINMVQYVEEKAKSIAEARNKGVNNFDRFEYGEKMRKLLGDDFNTLSPEDQDNRIEYVKTLFRQEFEAEYQKRYNKASDAEKVKMEKNKKAEIKLFEEQLQLAFLGITEIKAEESVRFRNGHDIAEGKNVIFKVKKNATEIAGRMTHSWDIKKLQYFNAQGQMPTAEEHQNSVQASVSQMSSKDAYKYEADADAYKQAFYNGEVKDSFITEEYLTATTVGVGMGATTNVNMSAAEKATFLKHWDDHAQKYSDYDEVRGNYYAAVKEYIEKHPEAKQGIEDIKTRYKEQYGRSPDVPWAAQKRYDNRINERKQQKTDTQEITKKASAKELEQALITKPFEEVKKQYTKNSDRDYANVVLHNPKLKGHRQHIIGFIKTLSAEDLSDIIKGCNTDTFLFVLRNISPDKAGRLYDLSKGEKCYAARELGEKIIEEGQKNAAA